MTVSSVHRRLITSSGLVEDGQPLPVGQVRVAVGLVLRVEPAGAQPEDEPTARVDVDAGRLLGQQAGVAVGGAGDQLAEAARVVVRWESAASMVYASNTWVGSRRGTVSTWS